MEITEQRDREAVELRWPTAKLDLLVNDRRKIRLKQKGIHSDGRRTANCGEFEKLSPIDWKERQTFGSNYKVFRRPSAPSAYSERLI